MSENSTCNYLQSIEKKKSQVLQKCLPVNIPFKPMAQNSLLMTTTVSRRPEFYFTTKLIMLISTTATSRVPTTAKLCVPTTQSPEGTGPSQLLKHSCLMGSSRTLRPRPHSRRGGSRPRGTSTSPPCLTGRAAPQPLGDAPQVSVQPAEDLV